MLLAYHAVHDDIRISLYVIWWHNKILSGYQPHRIVHENPRFRDQFCLYGQRPDTTSDPDDRDAVNVSPVGIHEPPDAAVSSSGL